MREVLLAAVLVACGGGEGPQAEGTPNGGAGGLSATAGVSGAGEPAGGGIGGAAGQAGGGAGAAQGGKAGSGGGSTPKGGAAGQGGQGSAGGGAGAGPAGSAGTAGASGGGAGSGGAKPSEGSPCDCYATFFQNKAFCVAADNAKGFVCIECGPDLDCDGDTIEPAIGSGCEVHTGSFCPL